MKVGDVVTVIDHETGEEFQDRIMQGMPSAGIYTTESGIPFWASGIQWISDKAKERGDKRRYSIKE